jgi:hypothetical protein
MQLAQAIAPATQQTWEVSRPGHEATLVVAPNWVVALGEAMGQSGRIADVTRLACERLMNGTIIVTDTARGSRTIIRPARAAQAA